MALYVIQKCKMAELEEIYDVANTKIDELDMMGDDKEAEEWQDMYYEMGVRDGIGAAFRNCELDTNAYGNKLIGIEYDAGHDKYGNPIVGIQLLDCSNGITANNYRFIPYGYAGRDAIKRYADLDDIIFVQYVKVSKREFKRISKL